DGTYTVKLTVKDNDGATDTATDNAVTVTDNTPTITKINPNSGLEGTTGVKIEGTNFSSTPGDNTVKFGTQGATVTSATATEMGVTVPGGLTPGEYDLTVEVGGKTSDPKTFTVLKQGSPQYPIKGSTASIQTGKDGVCLGCGTSNETNIIDGDE